LRQYGGQGRSFVFSQNSELTGKERVIELTALTADAQGLRPPIWPGATPPVSRNRRTQLITVLGATPKRAADSYRDSPSFKTAATARSRRSIE
jgi:hypothetical protein